MLPPKSTLKIINVESDQKMFDLQKAVLILAL